MPKERLPEGKTEPLSVRILASTDKDLRKIAYDTNRTIASCTDWLLRDAIYWWKQQQGDK